MNFEFGEVLTSAWQITWKNKVLWWFGAALGVFVLAILPVAFVPMSLPFLLRGERTDLLPFFMIGIVLFILLFFVIMYFVSAITQTAITLGVLQAQEERRMSFRDLLTNSKPFFWRVLGLMFLYAVVIAVVNLAVQALVFALAVGTLGLGMMCATPLYLLMYPFMFAAVAWMEQAMNGIIIDNMGIRQSVKQGWQLIRNNVMAIVLIMVVVYFGVGMVSTIVVMPLMAPFFVIPFGFLEGEPNWTIISLSLLCSVPFVPLMALVNGWAMTFMKSAWVLTYLRLTRAPAAPQPILQEVPA